MRAMWTGAVSFGLVNVPVRLYPATASHDVRFHQVHGEDGGRIRYRRVCEACGQEISYADIVKGYETEDGELIMLTEDDLAALPSSGGREIEVVEFVPADQVDPLLLDKAYYLEPDKRAAKPYALLREALRETDRMAVVTVTLRQKEALALLRVRDQVIVLQTMLWPDEVREPEFEILGGAPPDLRPQEMRMAASLIESMGADFDPARFTDGYREAVLEVIERKRSTGQTQAAPAPAPAVAGADDMSDLLAALEASVAAATAASTSATQVTTRGDSGSDPEIPAQRSPSTKTDGKTTGSKATDGKATGSKATDGKTTGSKATGGKATGGKTPRRARKSA